MASSPSTTSSIIQLIKAYYSVTGKSLKESKKDIDDLRYGKIPNIILELSPRGVNHMKKYFIIECMEFFGKNDPLFNLN